jgi:hypothetical protein
MKEFNLEKALQGQPVVTRNGKNVFKLQKIDLGNITLTFPLVGYVEKNWCKECWTLKGKFWREKNQESNLDLFMKDKDDEKPL